MPLLLTISGFSLALVGAAILVADRLGRMRIKVRVARPGVATHSPALATAPETIPVAPAPSSQMALFEQTPPAPAVEVPVPVLETPQPSPVLSVVGPAIEEPPPESSATLAPDPSRRARSHTSERLDWAYFNKDLGDLQDPGTPRMQPAPAPRPQVRRPPRSA